MGKRIRYEPTHNSGELASVKVYPVETGESYRVYLNGEGMYQIVDVNHANQVMHVGAANSSGDLKRKAKKYLESLGVIFADEKRNKVKNSVDI